MRNIKIIISTLAVLLSFTACTDLSETLYNKVQSSDYGKSPAEIETIVGGAYASLRGKGGDPSKINSYPGGEFLLFANETASDEVCIPTRGSDWKDDYVYQRSLTHTWLPDSKLYFGSWTYCYEGIGKVNSVIYQVKKSELTDDEKAVVYAELRALRAYYYYILLDMFGNVPLVTNFEDLELPTNSPREEIYKFIETEILEVIDLLPKEIIYGRFTQNVANTLLARLYLNSEVYVGTSRWQDCIDACDKVTGYILEPNFFTSFLTENQVSKEIIFAIPYDFTVEKTEGHDILALSMHYKQKQAISATSNYTDCVNGICLQPGVYSKYEEADVRRDGFLVGDQISLATGSVILMDDGTPLSYTDGIVDFYNAIQNEGIRCVKYELKEGQSWDQDHDLVVMRYSEILLMKAECIIRMGSSALARPFIAQVRDRVKLDTPAEVTLDFLSDELLREFIMEGHRRTDNIRMGNFFKPNWLKTEITPAYRSLFPIPSRAMELNNKLVQNPGY